MGLRSLYRLQDNPTPYEFPISVLGAKPLVAVRLDTLPSAEASENQHAPTNGQRRTSDAGSLAKAPAKQAAVKGGKAAEYTIKFDRLLLNKRDTQAFTISNTGVLPFKWRLAGVTQLPAEFKVYPSEGELAARSKVQVTVEFSALKKQELYELVTLEVRWCAIQCISTSPAAVFWLNDHGECVDKPLMSSGAC